MIYRNDVEALEARYRALEAELALRTQARDEAARMLAEARARADREAELADIVSGRRAHRRRRQRTILGVFTLLTLLGIQLGYRLATYDGTCRVEQMLQRYAEFADQTCICMNSACVQHVTGEMSKWAAEMVREDPSPKIDEDLIKRATAIGERMAKCMTRAMTTETSAANAAAEQP